MFDEIKVKDGQVYKDVASVLGYKDTRKALNKHIDKEDKVYINLPHIEYEKK